MTDQELKDLAQAMHEIQYVVPGLITEFEMKFETVTAVVKWMDHRNSYTLDYVRDDT